METFKQLVTRLALEIDPIAPPDTDLGLLMHFAERLRDELIQNQEPVAEVHASHLKPAEIGDHWCRVVALYSGNSPHDFLSGKNTRVKLYAKPFVTKDFT
jgi:hypothetical protein